MTNEQRADSHNQFAIDFDPDVPPIDDQTKQFARQRYNLIYHRPSYLRDEEVQSRIDSFEQGPHTHEAASDWGLTAFAVPLSFGGLFVARRDTTNFGHARLAPLTIYREIMLHHSVCYLIDLLGTYAQYDMFLPQMAAGKCIATMANATATAVTGYRYLDTYILSGTIATLTPWDERMLICFSCVIDDRIRWFVVPKNLLIGSCNFTAGTGFELSSCVVSHSCLLDGVDNPPPSDDKWRAIRWNSAPSES